MLFQVGMFNILRTYVDILTIAIAEKNEAFNYVNCCYISSFKDFDKQESMYWNLEKENLFI